MIFWKKCDTLSTVNLSLIITVGSLVSEAVKREITIPFTPLKAKITVHEQTIAALKPSANDQSDKLTNLETKISKLTDMVDSLSKNVKTEG